MGRIFNSYQPARRNGAQAFVSVTSSGSSDVQTLTPPPDATACFISCDGTDGRFTCDGATNPTATVGHILRAAMGAPIFLPMAVPLRWVSTAGTAAVLQVTWLE